MPLTDTTAILSTVIDVRGVEAARRQPQTVTKHGKPTVVVVAADEYERLRRLDRGQAPSFAELLLAMPQDGGEFPRLKARSRDVEL